jgi:hypothetical protein
MFADLVGGGEHAVHAADGAGVAASIEQRAQGLFTPIIRAICMNRTMVHLGRQLSSERRWDR